MLSGRDFRRTVAGFFPEQVTTQLCRPPCPFSMMLAMPSLCLRRRKNARIAVEVDGGSYCARPGSIYPSDLQRISSSCPSFDCRAPGALFTYKVNHAFGSLLLMPGGNLTGGNLTEGNELSRWIAT